MRAPTLPHRIVPWLRRLAWALAALLTIWALAWLGGPPLLRWQIERQASAALGRSVQVAAVRFQPWSLTLRVEGLTVAGATGTDAAPVLAIDEVYVNAELQSLLRLAPVVDALRLQRPRLTLTHLGEGRYDVDDLLKRLLAPRPADQAPTKFALYNIAVTDGEVRFRDAPRDTTHTVDALQLHVPFLSNLEARREVVTHPRLAFRLNGAAFDSEADTTPFAPDRHTEAHLRLTGLDIAPYLPYWPARWPLQPRRGTLDVDLSMRFEQHERPQVSLQGGLTLHRLQLQESLEASSTPDLFTAERLHIGVGPTRPLERQLALSRVELDRPTLHLRRDGQGRLHLNRVVERWQPTAPGGTTAAPATPSHAQAPGWRMTLDTAQVRGGVLHWHDASTRPAAALNATDLSLHVQGFNWPEGAPAELHGNVLLAGTPLSWAGRASARSAEVRLNASDLPIGPLQPYTAAHLRPALAGYLTLDATMDWALAAGDSPARLALHGPTLRLDRLTLGTPRQPDVAWQALQISGWQIDLIQQTVVAEQVRLERPTVRWRRAANGRSMVEDWIPTRTTPNTAAGAKAPPAQPWQVGVREWLVEGGTVQWRDASVAPAVALDATQLRLRVQQLRTGTEPAPAMPVTLVARIQPPGRDGGRVSFDGRLQLPGPSARTAPLAVTGRLKAERLPVHALEPYAAPYLNFELLRADASYQGTLALRLPAEGASLQLKGNAAVEDLRAVTRDPAEDLLDWKALNLRQLEVDVQRGALQRLAIGETVLSDYFARVIIDPSGRFNLQGLLTPQTATATDGPNPPAAAPGPTPRIDFGPIALVNGRVRFSDRFIQPNYTANLSELTGQLGRFSSQPPTNGPVLAPLSLRGRVEGTASLDITGDLNPLAQPLALDLRGQVRDLELPPLTPYSSKYAGYGIERGKLSVDVNYRVAPDGQLQASNQIVLNQLRFGDRIAGSEAPNLPVKLAVALLADRHGVIDINLPISGSINDPEFRLGPIIVRLVLNLIGKAITAPFSLIASAFSGGDDLRHIAFEPGRTVLTPDTLGSLDKVAQALLDRPALQLTVTGHSAGESERDAYRRDRLQERVLSEKRRRLLRDGGPADAPITVSADEYPTLLREVYRRADITKPRNLVGLAKDLAVAEMESLLIAAIPYGATEAGALAVARGMAVKDHLAARGVPAERLFLGTGETKAPGTAPTDDAPRADLTLAVP